MPQDMRLAGQKEENKRARRGKPRALSLAQKNWAAAKLGQGFTQKSVARELHVSTRTLRGAIYGKSSTSVYVAESIGSHKVQRATRVMDLWELLALVLGPAVAQEIDGVPRKAKPLLITDFARITKSQGDTIRQVFKRMRDMLAGFGIRFELAQSEDGSPSVIEFDIPALSKWVKREIKAAGEVIENHDKQRRSKK